MPGTAKKRPYAKFHPIDIEDRATTRRRRSDARSLPTACRRASSLPVPIVPFHACLPGQALLRHFTRRFADVPRHGRPFRHASSLMMLAQSVASGVPTT